MPIDEAIKNLQAAKARGIKNIVLAWWRAEDFDKPDDDDWAATAELVEDKMDWSSTHDTMEVLIKETSL
jgi:hypothetical protein